MSSVKDKMNVEMPIQIMKKNDNKLSKKMGQTNKEVKMMGKPNQKIKKRLGM